jgi:transcriptional regulator with XRE-family HTH domain
MDAGTTAMNDLSARLRPLRNDAGLTQAAVAAAAGIEIASLSRIENGTRSLSIDTLGRVLAVYGYKLSIVPNESTPEDTEALVLLVQAGRALNDAVTSLLHDPNAGSLMERFTVLERLSKSFDRIDSLVHKEQDDDS